MRLALGLLLFAAGCDPGRFAEPAAPPTCAAVGARCQLPDGPLGVCLAAPCAAGTPGPCFVCTPQH